jgi:hypothetical protein
MSNKQVSLNENARVIRHVEKFETIKAVSDRYDEIMRLQESMFCYPEPPFQDANGKHILVWTEHKK